MNRINQLFKTRSGKILSIYFTAGYPSLESTSTIIKILADAGADMIEVGIPFSDPMADGPVIQKSNDIALKNGMSLKLLFSQLKTFRTAVDTPLLLMGYFNPVLQFGVENFCRQCSETGVDGVIIPDLPLEVYEAQYKSLFGRNNLSAIFLISPQTSEKRILKIDRISNGFIYMVSSSATTGEKNSFSPEQYAYFKRIRDTKLDNPLLIGFGISDSNTFTSACKYAQGAIIGSAFVKMLGTERDISEGILRFVREIKMDIKENARDLS
jgi:tryptophan synthase alpha chain